MKKISLFPSLLLSTICSLGLLDSSSSAAPTVLAGPVVNPTNAHGYYLLSESTWQDAQSKALAMGGNLVTINNQAEQDWVFSQFGNLGGTNRSLWIGLREVNTEGNWQWVSGDAYSYARWISGQPDNSSKVQGPAGDSFAHMIKSGNIWSHPGGYWNDIKSPNTDAPSINPICGVVEIADTDGDQISGEVETVIGSNPNDPDTDGDGLKDGAEYLLADLGFDPLVPNGELMTSLFVPSFYPSIEIFAPASTVLKISLGGVDTVSTNSVPSGWVFNTSTKQMSGVLSGITSSSGQMTGGKTNGLNLPVTFNFHPQNRQSIARLARIPAKRVNAPPFVVLPPIASSGLPVILSVKSGPATISSNNVVTITGIGTVVIAANQPGNKNFLPAPEVTTFFRVIP